MHIELSALIVDDYDDAIRFFVDILGFELVEDSLANTTDGRPKRWVVVQPPGASTGLLLAKADGDHQAQIVGEQWAGRVGAFLRVDDFEASYERMVAAGVEFVRPVREEAYGKVTVFVDVAGNRWDLLGPRVESSAPPVGPLVVRRERREDEVSAREVQLAAFGAGGREPVEGRLLDELRRCDGWLPALSWIAEIDGGIVGHNVATRGYVDAVACVGLGPIGVTPGRQRGGIGSALMRAMIGAADATGEPLIALLGSPDYYSRFGFQPSTDYGIDAPDSGWGPYFQVLPLSSWDDSITGRFRYAAPFGELDE